VGSHGTLAAGPNHVPAILDRFQLATIHILKVDLEGAERQVNHQCARAWLDRVRLFAIALHDETRQAAFAAVVASSTGRTTCAHDVTLWRRTPER
jgi:hypothetical protein